MAPILYEPESPVLTGGEEQYVHLFSRADILMRFEKVGSGGGVGGGNGKVRVMEVTDIDTRWGNRSPLALFDRRAACSTPPSSSSVETELELEGVDSNVSTPPLLLSPPPSPPPPFMLADGEALPECLDAYKHIIVRRSVCTHVDGWRARPLATPLSEWIVMSRETSSARHLLDDPDAGVAISNNLALLARGRDRDALEAAVYLARFTFRDALAYERGVQSYIMRKHRVMHVISPMSFNDIYTLKVRREGERGTPPISHLSSPRNVLMGH